MTLNSISKLNAGFLAAVLAVASFSPASQAQSPDHVAKVNVPFAFQVGSTHFPAGQYLLNSERAHVLAILGRSESALAMTRYDVNYKPSATGKVVFRKFGDQYFLSEVWVAGSMEHLSCVKSKAEQQAEKSQLAAIASSAPTPVASSAPTPADTRAEVAVLNSTK